MSKSTQTTVSCDFDTAEEFRGIADKEGRSRPKMLRYMVDFWKRGHCRKCNRELKLLKCC